MVDQHKENQQTNDNLTKLNISQEKYLKYNHKDRPGLARFYDTGDKINNAATKAIEMVEKLCE
jgi:hypothetical protein